jgi:predicted extracellular nuclease
MAKANRFLSLGLIFIFVVGLVFVPGGKVQAVSTSVVISQVYGAGGNSGALLQNDYVELYNLGSTEVSLAGWSIQYASATGTGNFGSTTTQRTELSGSIKPGHYFLVQESGGSNGSPLPSPDLIDPTAIAMAAGAGKVALVNTTTPLGCNGGSTPCSPAALANIVDLVGYGNANFYEGTGAAPTISTILADFRLNNGAQDTDDNNADFVTGAPNPRNSTYPFAAVGLATPAAVVPGQATLLTVAVTSGTDPASTGITVICDLSSIGGDPAQAFYDDGTNGDKTAEDKVFSFSAIGPASGTPNITCNFADSEGRSGTAKISLNLIIVIPIGQVNGLVDEGDSCTSHASPDVGQTVTIQGVIYEKTLQATSGSYTYKGFFIQNAAATADGDPNTSDGLFVYMSSYTSLIGGYVPTVGDEVAITGKVSEYYNMTELGSASMLSLVRSGVDIDSEVAPVVADPPISLSVANCYWERLQGMRVQVPQDSIVLGGRNVFSPADAEIWLARPDSTIAERVDPYARKAFRDAHILDDNYDPTSWDGNGYRMLIGSLGIKAAAGDAQALVDPARSYSTLDAPVAGGLNYTYSKYRIEISDQPSFTEGVDPALNNPPTAIADRSQAFNIVDYNLENLYDYRNNPFSGCDFATDSGCSHLGTPFIADVSPSFNYVPASDADYQARLNDIALEIINDLHSPDVIAVQEVENQDICTVTEGVFTCGATDNADGKPDVLQELALKIASLGGPAYDAAFDRDSSDLRGIAPAFLYRTDRVQLVSPLGDPVLGMTPTIGGYTSVPYDSDVSNPKTLNAVYEGTGACETNWVFPRAPDIGLFRIWSTSIDVGSYRDVYVINNHFKSGPDTCVAHRTEQANYNAALVAYIQAQNQYANIVVAGDFNVYPRPDDPFAPIGQPGSSDQLGALYDPALDLTNLWDVLLAQAPESAYSYIYVGMVQTLDQMFVNPLMLAKLQQFRIAHINSDFPADYAGDVARGTSDHDPNVATFGITFSGFFMPIENPPALNLVKAGSSVPVQFSLGGDMGLNIFATGYPTSTQIACDTSESQDDIQNTLTAGASGLSYDPFTGVYTYAWKTLKSWADTCRQLTVMLADGTVQTANFEFK